MTAIPRHLCAAFGLFGLLSACVPMTVEQAERACAPRAYLAQKPQSSVSVGVNNKGETLMGASFGISTDFIAGRDPNIVFRDCVKERAQQFPIRNFTDYPNTGPNLG